ncbi:MAG: hypothetical protein M1831_005094 [Alyxoria varia]|nr:MAG: hypothetical protein M1831_005094 [Alyxoria varia]
MPPTSSSLTPAEPGAFSDHNGIQREDNYRSSPPASHGQAPMLPPLKRMASPMSLDLRPASRRLPTAAPTSSPSSVDTNFFRGGEKQQTSCHLRIRQQPEAARACGFGERDRRVIDPPPVLELEAANGSGAFSDIEDLHLSFYSVHASLWSQDGNDDLTTFTQQTGKAARRLVGSLVASPAVATDEQNRRGAFFTFADLSCRETGHFRLRFTLVRIDPTKIGPGAAAPMLASLLSDVFTVYSPKDFPGMRRSTPLTQALKIQGVAIPAKKGRSGPVSKQAHGSDSSRERVRSYDMEGRDVIPHFAQRHI